MKNNGYSRDHRPHFTFGAQINVGLICNEEGTPLSAEIFAGNIGDKSTIETQIAKLSKKHGIKEVSFIIDRGMKSKVNLQKLQDAGYQYITALSHAELSKKFQENKAMQMGLFDKKNLAEIVIDDEKEGEKNKKLVLCHNPFKAEEDGKTRQKLIDKTKARLVEIQKFKRKYTTLELQDKVSKAINRFGCEKYFDYEISEKDENLKGKTKKIGVLSFEINETVVATAEKYDGFYCLESSDIELDGEVIRQRYKDLQLVERAFDALKNHIAIRPVFHYKSTRIKGHIYSCFLSYYLLHKFKLKCSELLKTNTLDNLLSELQNLHVTYFKLDKFQFSKKQIPNPLQNQIISACNTKPTPKSNKSLL